MTRDHKMYFDEHAIFNKVKALLIERFVIDEALITSEVQLQKELDMDSMDAMDLLLAVNDVFQIQVPEQSLADIHTVGDLVAIIKKYRPKA